MGKAPRLVPIDNTIPADAYGLFVGTRCRQSRAPSLPLLEESRASPLARSGTNACPSPGSRSTTTSMETTTPLQSSCCFHFIVVIPKAISSYETHMMIIGSYYECWCWWANYVSVIQMTDVGLGICGLEGRQVVMASDFVMEQFCFVKKSLIRRGTGTIRSTWYSTHYWFLPL
uniref:Phospholipid-transporting ATPase 1 n=1 Tax=Aegilops tauschii TaxID=37682 RepID=M8C3L0_AEGTA